MNTTKRFFLGLLSSLFLAAGFLRAADRFDPTNRSAPDLSEGVQANPAPDSSGECWADSDNR